MPRPDFIIAGVSRSGTTSLYRWLADHPAVGAAPQKEVRFFDDNYDNGMSWYEAQFPSEGILGEASPRYMAHPGGRAADCRPPPRREVDLCAEGASRACVL